MLFDVEASELTEVVVGHADLGERDHAVLHAQQFEDAQMFFGLRLPSLGRRDDEDARVDGTDTREHVLDEAHVTRDIDDRDRTARRQFARGEAEIDGESSCLLLGPTIGVDAGQRVHHRGLAVIDMARGGDDVHQSAANAART